MKVIKGFYIMYKRSNLNIFVSTLIFFNAIQFCMSGDSFNLCSAEVNKPKLCKHDRYMVANVPPDPLPVNVTPVLDLKNILRVDTERETVTVFMRIVLQWKDMGISVNTPNKTKYQAEWYEIMGSEVKRIWRPDLAFLHMTDNKILVTYGNEEKFSFWINTEDNSMEYIESIRVTFSCRFSFTDYPLDEHHCPLKFGSETVSTDKLFFEGVKILNIDGNATELTEKIRFENEHLPYDMWIEAIKPFSHYNIGHFSPYIGVTLILKRNTLGDLIAGYYIPTSIFAIFSMISFFIDPDVVPGRMGLLVTLFLISSNVFNSLKAPSGRGFSYIETWLVGAQGPIIIAIIEYGMILAWKRDSKISAYKIRKMGK